MGKSPTAISFREFGQSIGTPFCPYVFDVRRAETYAEAADLIPTAKWRDHRLAKVWARDVPSGCDVVVYCVQGHQVSQSAAALLRSCGVRARYLEGGIETYRGLGGPLIRKTGSPKRTEDQPSRWVTRERPKIDRIACPWLIRRFVDREAVIHFVSSECVRDAAVELDATPFDIPDTAFSHDGELCSFDAFLARFGITDAALMRLAEIVRGAETGRLELASQASGLLAISLGLSAIESDDRVMLEKGLVVYDALYGWCRFAADEAHGWPPVAAAKAHATGVGQ